MTKLQEFMDQVRDIDNQIAELELLREALYHRVDEELEKEGKL
jgi:hypothetical protein